MARTRAFGPPLGEQVLHFRHAPLPHGWGKLTHGAWAAISSQLIEAKVVWSIEACLYDLEQWRTLESLGYIDQAPSYRTLAKRWKWTEWAARKLVSGSVKTPRTNADFHGASLKALPMLSQSPPNPLPLEDGQSGIIENFSPNALPKPSQCSRKVRVTRACTKEIGRKEETKKHTPLPPSPGEPVSPSLFAHPSEEQPKAEVKPKLPEVPTWVPRLKGVDRRALWEACRRIVEAIRQRPAGERWATDGKTVIKHWRALDKPTDLEAWVADVELVARAARESDDRMFARHLRAEGWAEGTDRSRSVATLLRHEKWADRLEAARAWAARIDSLGADGSPEASGPDMTPPKSGAAQKGQNGRETRCRVFSPREAWVDMLAHGPFGQEYLTALSMGKIQLAGADPEKSRERWPEARIMLLAETVEEHQLRLKALNAVGGFRRWRMGNVEHDHRNMKFGFYEHYEANVARARRVAKSNLRRVA